MNFADVKAIIFEEKNLLKELLSLLDNQYDYILGQEVMKVDKVARDLDELSKKIAKAEIERRKIMGPETNVGKVIDEINDEALNKAYLEIQSLLSNIQIQKEANDELLKNKIFYTKKMINIINPNRPNPTYNAYGQMRK